MSVKKLVFSKDWNHPEDFPPVVSNAIQARANIQQLHDETRSYLNDVLTVEVDQRAMAKMPDDSHPEQKYRLGIDNGMLYFEEVAK